MLLSIAVPTHSVRFLREAAWSVAQQTFRDFELVILANGEATPAKVAEAIYGLDLPRVRILEASPETPRTIGALKREAFMACQGDYVVELDHDDLLSPDCLTKIAEFAKGDDAPDFIYSNMAPFKDGNWSKDDLWCATIDTRPVSVYGHGLLEGVVIPVTPAMFLNGGTTGPVHVRAWRRSFYEKIGGHRQDFTIMDDADLIIRTYIAGGKFHHIDECLYLYRCTLTQTSANSKPLIPYGEFTQYYPACVEPILRRWCRDESLIFIDSWEMFDTLLRSGWTNVVGAFFMDRTEKRPSVETLTAAWNLLIHGGWFVALNAQWKAAEIFQFTRPADAPLDLKEKFQELHVETKYEKDPATGAMLLDSRTTRAHMVAAKGGPLAGNHHWNPRFNEVDARSLRPTFEQLGATVTIEGGIVIVTGGRLELVKQLAEVMSGSFPGMIKTREA
jgi:glycosyltransferase involved in cell wall biosynthesis